MGGSGGGIRQNHGGTKNRKGGKRSQGAGTRSSNEGCCYHSSLLPRLQSAKGPQKQIEKGRERWKGKEERKEVIKRSAPQSHCCRKITLLCTFPFPVIPCVIFFFVPLFSIKTLTTFLKKKPPPLLKKKKKKKKKK